MISLVLHMISKHYNTLRYNRDRQTDTLALLPLVKRQVFCVGDRLKMDKHKAWATTIVAPKSVGSLTTKGQMKPTDFQKKSWKKNSTVIVN